MSQTFEKAVIDERGWVRIPPAIRMHMGLLKKTNIAVMSYKDGIIMVRHVSDGESGDMIKKAQTVLRLEESFKAIHAKNLNISDEEIAEEIKKHRRAKRRAG